MSLGRDEAGATISEGVGVGGDVERGFGVQFVGLEEIVRARRMNVEKGDHRCGRRDFKLQVVA